MVSDGAILLMGAGALNFVTMHKYNKLLGSIIFMIIGIAMSALATSTGETIAGVIIALTGISSGIYAGIQRFMGDKPKI